MMDDISSLLTKDFETILEIVNETDNVGGGKYDDIVSNIENGSFLCKICNKMYKTQGLLKMHDEKKHQNNQKTDTDIPALTLQDIFDVINSTFEKVLDNPVYSSEKLELKSYHNDFGKDDCLLLHNYFKALKFKTSETFMTKFYAEVVSKGKEFLPKFNDESIASLILVKSGHSFLNKFQNKERIIMEEDSHNLSDRQVFGLQYIAGHILHKLYSKIRNSKNYSSVESQYCMAILEASRETDIEKSENQKLISALNRGGLWHASKDILQLFIICEKYFLRKTDGKPNKNIKINAIISDIVKFTFTQDLFLKIVKEALEYTHEKHKDVVKNLLHSMVQLYIRIRMFSLVKDYNERQRKEKFFKAKEKSLRQSLKRKVTQEDDDLA